MTPTAAAATVLHAISCKCDGYATTPLHESFYLGKAEEFFAALPEGWRLCGPDDVTVTVEGLSGALGQVESILGTKPLTVIAVAILAALSADEEEQK